MVSVLLRPLLTLLVCSLSFSVALSAASVRVELPASPSARVLYGAQRLGSALQEAGHSEVPSSAAQKPDYLITLSLQEPAPTSASASSTRSAEEHSGTRLKSEGFRLQADSAQHLALLGADDNGLLYGLLELATRIRTQGLPAAPFSLTDAPALRLRGPCIGMQKTSILPGYHVYEYPYREDLFPFFYDRDAWLRYLDFLVDNRMNSLYLWNGHPFASLVRLPEYPYAQEVSDEQFAKNVEQFRFIAKEADKRGIWVVQMFYSIILSKPFAEHNGISTQLSAPLPIANDYMRKSIAAFVREYPNVGLMACLGEALKGVDNQIVWCNDVILAGVKDGMREAGLSKEPPVVIRTHATDPRAVMAAALPHYSNLYTEAKFNGESLTTWEPRGTWQKIHQDMAKLGSTHIANVHILANLEPFRYGAQRFIHKSVLAMRDRLGAGGLHLYPLAYWNWPDAPDSSPSPLAQIDRDWIWYEAWARYAWNPDVDEESDRQYWITRLTERFGTAEAAGFILDAYNDSGECAPRLLRRFGITEGNRQTLSLGMTLEQLVDPGRYRPYDELWKSQSPEGERLQEFVDKEWNHISHHGETPTRIVEEVLAYSAKAVEAAEKAAPFVTKNRAEFERLRNDTLCIQAMSRSYAAKALAAIRVLRFRYSEDLSDMDQAASLLEESLKHYRTLADLTRNTYHFANSMQTAQRRIPISGGLDGKPANYHWTQLVPFYEKELADFKAQLVLLHEGKLKPNFSRLAPLKKATIRLLSDSGQLYQPGTGSHPFTDKPWEFQSIAPELTKLGGIRFSYTETSEGRYQPLVFDCDQPVRLLVGYLQSKDPAFLQVPELETDALAGENFVSEPLIQNAATVDELPPINIHVHRFPAGRNRLEVRGSGAFVVLGIAVDEGDAAATAPALTASAALSQPASPPAAPAEGRDSRSSVAAQASPLPSTAPAQTAEQASLFVKKPLSQARYKIAVCDWMILKRQKLGAFQLTAEIGADGLELDIGGLGKRESWDNKLLDPALRTQFQEKADSLGLQLSSIALSGFYAQSFAARPNYVHLVTEALELATAMHAKVLFLPLGVQGDLVLHPELRPVIIERLRTLAPLAEKAGIVIGIETALAATDEAKLLDEIGSPAIKSYFNFANALQNGRDLLSELRILGASRIAQIHCTDEDGVWLQNNTRLDLSAVKKFLDESSWSGWLVIERSRDAKDPRNVRRNFSANAAYLKSIFQP